MEAVSRRRLSVAGVSLVLVLLWAVAAEPAMGQGAPAAAPSQQPTVTAPAQVRLDLAIAVGLSVGLPCLAAGYAVGKVGSAALGAAAERPELLARSLILVALGEGIAVFGTVIAMLILFVKF